MANKLYWMIRGFDSTKPIFEERVGLGQFTEQQIQRVLQALTAKAGLRFTEIVGAYARRRSKIANKLLEVHRDGLTYLCGTNPHFVASVVDESGKIVRPTPLQ